METSWTTSQNTLSRPGFVEQKSSNCSLRHGFMSTPRTLLFRISRPKISLFNTAYRKSAILLKGSSTLRTSTCKTHARKTSYESNCWEWVVSCILSHRGRYLILITLQSSAGPSQRISSLSMMFCLEKLSLNVGSENTATGKVSTMKLLDYC